MTIVKVISCSILLIGSFYGDASDKKINVNAVASYYDEKVIQSNILNECTELGVQFSESTKTYLEKGGWSVDLISDNNESLQETKLELQIINAMSSGNALIGHRKSVSIEAKLYKNGSVVDTYKRTRNSGGGFMGGFKGSCSVLARCVHTLGNDVSKWLIKKDKSN